MGSKTPLRRTRRPSDVPDPRDRVIRILEQRIRAAERRELELLALVREKDEQIHTVIDEKYFHPVNLAPKAAEPKRITSPDVSHLNDQPQFDPAKDAEVVELEEQAFQEAETQFNEELAALEAEHAASHAKEAGQEAAPVGVPA